MSDYMVGPCGRLSCAFRVLNYNGGIYTLGARQNALSCLSRWDNTKYLQLLLNSLERREVLKKSLLIKNYQFKWTSHYVNWLII